jgi:NADH-quinone oxidoreductase subunit N
MNGTDYMAILPLLVIGYAGPVLMTLIAFWQSQKLAYIFTLVSIAAAFGALFIAVPHAPCSVTPLLQVDLYSIFFSGLILIAAFLVTLLCPQYVENHVKRGAALYVLLLFAVLGMMTLAASIHFVSFFLGLEILSVSLYGLIGYTLRSKPSLEAAIKYLVLAATASALLLFGIALVYSELGSLDFRVLAPILAEGHLTLATLFGLMLIVAAFGFKLAFAPFHMWSPDVYQGSPAPITAMIATASKVSVFALLLRFVFMAQLHMNSDIFLALTVLAILSMTAGNLLALMQTNVKRILAYSSIAHMGYLIIPLLAGGAQGASSITFYLVSYVATVVAAFGVVVVLSSSLKSGDVENLNDYKGLAKRNPVLAAIMTLALLSLTGIPLTSGFFAKLYIFSAAVNSGLWLLLIVGAINTGMSAFYYLRVVYAMFGSEPDKELAVPVPGSSSQIALVISSAIILFFGIYPVPLIYLAEVVTRLFSR